MIWPRWWVWWLKKCGTSTVIVLERVPLVAHVGEPAREPGLVQPGREGLDAGILGDAGGAQLVEVVVEDRVEPRRLRGAALEPGHPDSVADHDVIQRPVDAPEEGAAILAPGGIVELGARCVESFVGEPVVPAEHLEVGGES